MAEEQQNWYAAARWCGAAAGGGGVHVKLIQQCVQVVVEGHGRWWWHTKLGIGNGNEIGGGIVCRGGRGEMNYSAQEMPAGSV